MTLLVLHDDDNWDCFVGGELDGGTLMIPPTIAERGLSLVSLFFELPYMSIGGRGSQKN